MEEQEEEEVVVVLANILDGSGLLKPNHFYSSGMGRNN